MSASGSKVSSVISLKGSTAIVTEFFGFCINSILYQRGIYPPDKFQTVTKYGLPIHITNDRGLMNYLGQVLSQISEWVMSGSIQRFVIVISSAASGEVIERWVFNVETDKQMASSGRTSDKSEVEIQREIQALIRQITVTVTVLPLIKVPCTFDLLVYADEDVDIPAAWEESDPKYVIGATEIPIRSFTTKIHKVTPSVSYHEDD
ncbi:mitotic spindle assembly checkpoint protein MAD2 [Monocercomonoides exilis]|uniref:mitotic spindle assembly checkpoint protein MAD2 n=1 Tax=Monocercomonoides exilis TaxID=2049356 RepID=UPI00355A738B|nr:mitotic spindle assembly checkpoint protein MAD2 [Monocercomonoides exilis]